jgi:NADPH2:quinone reductase
MNMKSVIVTEFGGPEVIKLRDVPVPAPGPGQVLVRVKTAGINYADIMQRVGLYPNGPQPPYGAGFEISGIVEEVGEEVTQWKPGDAVMGFCGNGYSEYAVADSLGLLRKPEQLDFNQAAAIPCQFLTAYNCLLTLARLKHGQTVLIQAAAGGVGAFAVEIARNIGATVIGTASSEEKIALLRRLGCQHPINYIEKDFEEEVHKIMPDGVDVALESVGGQVFDKTVRCVKPRGHMVVIGAASGKPRGIQSMLLLVRNLTISGFHLIAYASDPVAMNNAQRDLARWLENGDLEVIVSHVYPLEQAAEAHIAISERKTTGKVVLKVAD